MRRASSRTHDHLRLLLAIVVANRRSADASRSWRPCGSAHYRPNLGNRLSEPSDSNRPLSPLNSSYNRVQVRAEIRDSHFPHRAKIGSNEQILTRPSQFPLRGAIQSPILSAADGRSGSSAGWHRHCRWGGFAPLPRNSALRLRAVRSPYAPDD